MMTVTPLLSAIRAPSSFMTPNWHQRAPAWIATASADDRRHRVRRAEDGDDVH
jgi:hypothetical protein